MTSTISKLAAKVLTPTLNGTIGSKLIVPVNNTPEGSAAAISICSVALLLNLIEIVLLLRKRKRITIFELWLLNLATADKIVSVFILVLESIRLGKGEETQAFNSARQAIDTIVHFSVYSSSCTLLVIAVDRFVAVKFPIKHRLWMTKKKAVIIIIMTWFVNIMISLLDFFLKGKAFGILDSIVIVLMSLLFLVMYSLIIYFTVVRRSKSTQHSGGADRDIQEMEIIATCVLVVISYQICMLPYAVTAALNVNKKDLPIFVLLMLYCNSVTNPLIYFFKGILGRKLKLKQSKSRGSKSNDVNSKTRSTQLALTQDSHAGESKQ